MADPNVAGCNVDPWVHPNSVFTIRNTVELQGRRHWDHRHAKKYDYESGDPRTPNGNPINMSYMSWMNEMPDRAIESFAKAQETRNRRIVGMKSTRSTTSFMDREVGKHGEAWSPGRGYRGGWSVFKKGDKEKQGLMSFQSSAHDHMRTQGKERCAIRRALETPKLNPAYHPSPNRMTPGTAAIYRNRCRADAALSPKISPITGLPMREGLATSKGKNSISELRQLMRELQTAMQRCSDKLKSKNAPQEIEALQKLSQQQQQALQGLEIELSKSIGE